MYIMCVCLFIAFSRRVGALQISIMIIIIIIIIAMLSARLHGVRGRAIRGRGVAGEAAIRETFQMLALGPCGVRPMV